jgi:hypothetical protein
MTEPEVHKILGPHLRRWPVDLDRDGVGESFAENWSFTPGDTHYRIRALVFTNNRVVRIYSEFYLD